jgi:hypothetical protein
MGSSVKVRARASRAPADEQRPHGAVFYYFLVGVDGRPYVPAVFTTDTADRRPGEVIVLADGSHVRVRGIEAPGEDEAAGLDGILVVEPHARR